MNTGKTDIKKLTLSAICLSLCLFLPLVTGNIPEIGKMLSPMHIPVYLCGFACGFPWGVLVGFIAPLLRGAVFGMPALVPGGIAMAFELATYGLLSGVLYRIFPKKLGFLYLTFFISMISGRIVWGIARFIISGVTKTDFTFGMFIAGGITNAIPGIILQLILIPVIVSALDRSGMMQ